MNLKIQDAKRIMDMAIDKYKPETILVGFTGGSDSLTLLHLMMELGYPFKPFFCNTGIGIEEQWEFIRSHCAKYNLGLIEQKPTYKLYKQIIIQNGFPGPSMHKIIFNDLKMKSITAISKYYDSKTIIVTGVRLSESERRKINISSEIQKQDGQIWVAPMMNWDDDDKDEYLETRKIERSPVSAKLGMSFECGCGAYATKGELEKVRYFYPNFAKVIDGLQDTLFKIGFTWGWDDPIPELSEYYDVMESIYPGYKEMKLFKQVAKKVTGKKKQTDLFLPMCHRCEHNYNIKMAKAV